MTQRTRGGEKQDTLWRVECGEGLSLLRSLSDHLGRRIQFRGSIRDRQLHWTMLVPGSDIELVLCQKGNFADLGREHICG